MAASVPGFTTKCWCAERQASLIRTSIAATFAPRFLAAQAVLVCEVGESEERLLELLPDLPFIWLEFSRGGSGVFILTREDLELAGTGLAALLEERKNVA